MYRNSGGGGGGGGVERGGTLRVDRGVTKALQMLTIRIRTN